MFFGISEILHLFVNIRFCLTKTFSFLICGTSLYFQVVEKAGSPHFEVEYKEKTTIFSANDIGTLIYRTMRGKYNTKEH